jgi:hypothetical protein
MNRRWGAYAPWPFVGVALLLVVLILVTPVLISDGQPAPGVLTQAELIVDRVNGGNTTHFYIRGLGSTVRYAGIRVDVATNFSWSGSGTVNWTALRYSTAENVTEVLSLGFALPDNPVALNISAYYVSPGGNALYVGEVAFYLGPSPGVSGDYLYATSSTSAVAVPSSPTPVDNASLPLPILLASVAPVRPL